MEQLHLPASAVADDIEMFAASYESPEGVPWKSQVSRGAMREHYVVRLWNSVVRDSHHCWVSFNVRPSDDSTVMDATVCSESHDSGKIRAHIVHSFWMAYGSN